MNLVGKEFREDGIDLVMVRGAAVLEVGFHGLFGGAGQPVFPITQTGRSSKPLPACQDVVFGV